MYKNVMRYKGVETVSLITDLFICWCDLNEHSTYLAYGSCFKGKSALDDILQATTQYKYGKSSLQAEGLLCHRVQVGGNSCGSKNQNRKYG